MLRALKTRYGNDDLARWYYEVTRAGSSPGGYAALLKSYMNMDVRSILPVIHVPTLVLHRTGDQIAGGRYIANHIRGAKLVELPGTLHNFYGEPEMADRIVEELRKFASEARGAASSDRMLATVLFTDIVDSTRKATALGDTRWQALLQRHNIMVTGEVSRFNGKVVKNTGDGFLATFDGPTRGIQCAWAIVNSARDLGIEVRAGMHTGECVAGSDDVSGVAVHIASRILDLASPGEVMVSNTVKDLVYGSGISFKDQGERELKGVEEMKRVYTVKAMG
jgi:class 3 adenylate cyclase